jgi:hypothetical protein
MPQAIPIQAHQGRFAAGEESSEDQQCRQRGEQNS